MCSLAGCIRDPNIDENYTSESKKHADKKYCCHKYYSAFIPCKNQFFACVKINNATGSQNYFKENFRLYIQLPKIFILQFLTSGFEKYFSKVLRWLTRNSHKFCLRSIGLTLCHENIVFPRRCFSSGLRVFNVHGKKGLYILKSLTIY